MHMRRSKAWPLALAAVLAVSCTCSLLPLGVNLPESLAVGSYITVRYPEGWFGTTDSGLGVFSPEVLDLEASDADIDQAFFLVIPLEEYLGTDWFGEIVDPDDLLNQMAAEFELSFGSTTTVELGNLRWTKGTFRGSLGEFAGTWQGWVAIELLPRGGAIIVAAAPEADWGDVDNIFDAMLRDLEFAD